MLYRKCRDKVVLPNMNFANTQLKNANLYLTNLTFTGKCKIPQKPYQFL